MTPERSSAVRNVIHKDLTRTIMERSILLTTFLGTAFIANAQLAPQRTAPLRDHLIEVNAEWNAYLTDLPDADRRISFSSDAERIAQHLHLVREHLVMETPEGLSADQAQHRADLLLDLERYADRGRFPQNHVLPFRNPIFIDPQNTACAVGQLIIESGDRALAERISNEMNEAYIRDMQWPEIGAWASTNGFTGDELAWIQPGYGPVIPWAPLGGGTNGEVSQLLRLQSGDLVLAGQFTEAGGTSRTHVARWNNTSYAAMGSLIDGIVSAAVEFDGEIYIGGSFNSGTVDMLHWNGTLWQPTTVFPGKSSEIHTFHVHNGMLHASGGRSGFAGTDYLVARLNNGDWENVGQVLNQPILALETFDGALIAGGSFTDNFLSTGNTILHAARLNGNTWEQLGNGLNGPVRDMLVHEGQLYATGDMASMMGTSFGLSRIAIEALTWEPLMPNIGNYITASPVDAPSYANAMVEKDGRIYIAGNIYCYQGLTYGTGVVVFNGTVDDVQPYCDFQGPAMDIDLLGSTLVVGGSSLAYNNIISTDITTGIGERAERLVLTVSPNPTTDLVTVRLPESLSGSVKFRIIDATGRLVESPSQRTGDLVRFSTQRLASGSYQIEVSNGPVMGTGRFVKE